MKNTAKKLLGFLVLVLAFSLSNDLHAQVKTIKEINITYNDGFAQLRNIIAVNFDFNKDIYKEGIVNSEVKFNVNEEGKIVNVVAKGDCKNVDSELENLFSHIQYKLPENSGRMATTYVMPIRLDISER